MVFVPRNSAKISISIRTKIILIIVFVFLVSSFGAYRTFIFLSENRTLSVYSDLTGRMRYASQQLVKALALGSENEIISAIGTFEFSFATLMNGSRELEILPIPEEFKSEYNEIFERWEKLKSGALNFVKLKNDADNDLKTLNEISLDIVNKLNLINARLSQYARMKFDAFIRFIILTVLISVLFLLGAIVYTEIFIVKPLVFLVQATNLIARGDFKVRLKLKTGDEIQNLGENFNLMAEKLGDLFGKLIKLERAITQSEDGVLITDVNGNIEYVNPAVEKISGYSADELIGQNPRIFKSGHHTVEFYREFWNTILSGKAFRGVFTNRRKDGRIFHAFETITPIVDESGKIAHFISTIKDITEQVEKERRQMIQNRAIFQILTNLARLPFEEALKFIAEESARVMEVDRVSIWKFSRERKFECIEVYELKEDKHLSSSISLDVDKYPEYFKAISGETSIYTSDVELDPRFKELWSDYWKPLGLRSSIDVPLWCGVESGQLGIVCFEHKERRNWREDEINFAEKIAQIVCMLLINEEIRRERLKLKEVVESAVAGLVLLSFDKSIITLNSSAREILKLLNGKEISIGDVLEDIAGVSIDVYLGISESTSISNEINFTQERIASDRGLRVLSELKRSGRIYEIVAYEVKSGYLLVIRDVTEERLTREKVVAQERLSIIGQLTAGIAHDFNNMLNVVLGISELMLRDTELPDKFRRKVDMIKDQVYRASNLTKQMLDFSRKSIYQKQVINLVQFMKEVISLLKRTLPENIKINFRYDEEHLIYADATSIQQVIMNLAINARDAMPEGGNLSFEIRRTEPPEEIFMPISQREIIDRKELMDKQWIVISVADTGVGIPENIIDKIFEPFFTTKPRGKGTGLGLSQVYGIIREHGGYVNVKSSVGKGTTFYIYLPEFVSEEVKPELNEEENEFISGQGEVILLVEDDPEVIEVNCQILESLNYRVLKATDGFSAIEVYRENKDKIDVVISDFLMPGMNGYELYKRLREINPDVKFIILSGYMEGVDSSTTGEQEGVSIYWAYKPIKVKEISELIRRILLPPVKHGIF
jgi:two-component system cell cycle sensor histidine kinase/response regulator CckA